MSQELRLKRLAYRSAHRGCKETDLLFGKFSEQKLANLSAAQLSTYEEFLNEDDADIWAWLTGKANPGAEYVELIDMLRDCGN